MATSDVKILHYINDLAWYQIYLVSFVGTLTLYFLIAGGAFLAVRRLKRQQSPLVLSPKPHQPKQITYEIQASVASIVVLAANVLVIRWLLAFGKVKILEGGTAVQLCTELLVLLAWNEVHFFVAHRLLHTKWLYHFHFVHHREPNISPFAIFRFHPIEAAALGSVIPLVLPFFNFHIESILLFVCASMLLNTLGHSGVDIFGSTRWPELLRASRRHFEHHKHHHVNFGFALPWFDRVLGSSLRNQMSRKAKAGILLFAVASGLSATGRAAPSLIDLNEFVRGQRLEQVLPAGDRVEIVNSIDDAPYGDPAQPVDLKMSCNQSVVVTQGAETKQSQQLSLRLWPSVHNGMRTFISVGRQQTAVSCTFKGDGFDVLLQSEKAKYPVVHELRAGGRECRPLAGRYGCAWSSEVTQPSAVILKNSYQAFASRFEMLMGYRLSEAEFVAKDPSMSLDFTKAPKLDLIVVDTLQILKDFVGVLTLRMLEWHSRQGTRVYFMTSRALLLPRETGWLYGFSKNNPNIHYSLYTSQDESETSQATTLEDRLHDMHRNNHIKVFLTLSKRQPSASAFIAGGRNLSEMYFFDKQPDNSRFPDIVQWGKEPFYDWTYFDDVDFKVSDPAAVERVAQEMIAFNEKRVLSRPDMQRPQNEIQNGFLFASPFGTSKGHQESAYIELIDRAERSLQIYTPYVNLTSALRAALVRARNRGVDVEITTNINLQGDFMPGILQPAMTRSIRKEFGSFAFRYFSRPGHIMHVKAIVIDRRALVLGSVNLNHRSFNHDTEVSIIFTDRQTIESFDEQMSVDIRPWVSPLRRSDIPRKTIMEFLVGPLMGVM